MFRKENGSLDIGFTAIVGLVVVIAAWLLLMPWVSSIASTTMHRFHLRSSSFTWFAIQTPIPSMYNFANTYSVDKIPPGLADPIFGRDETKTRFVNHYPARVFTFAGKRYQHLRHGTPRWLTITSNYRGQTLKTLLIANLNENGSGLKLSKQPVQEQP